MAISKSDLHFHLVTYLCDFWPKKTMEFCDEVDFICGLSLVMIGKKIATCIAENVTISFTHENRRHTLTSRCDVIGDVIIMTIILVDDSHTIFRYLLSNSGYI